MDLADSNLVKAIMTSSCEENVIASFHASHSQKLYFHMMVIAIFHVQPTVNDEISARGAYLKISSWQGALNRQGWLIKQGRLLNFVQNCKFIF